MYPVLLLIYITVSYAQLNSNDPEKVPGQYLSRKTQSHHPVPLDSVSFRTGSKGGMEYNQFNRIQTVIHAEKRHGDKTDGGEEIIKIHDVTSGEINNDRSEIKKKHDRKYFGKKSQNDVIISSHPERSSRYKRELRQDPSGLDYNGLPVTPHVEPQKDSNGKVAYHNGDVSHDDDGELKFNSGEETSTEVTDLVNRMAFIGDNCPTGYARIFKKCVPTY